MKTLRAVNTIVMTIVLGKAGDKSKGISPVRPEQVTILPKTRFKAQNVEQEAELLAMGAAVVADALLDDTVVGEAVTTPAKAAAKAAAKPQTSKVAPQPAAKSQTSKVAPQPVAAGTDGAGDENDEGADDADEGGDDTDEDLV